MRPQFNTQLKKLEAVGRATTPAEIEIYRKYDYVLEFTHENRTVDVALCRDTIGNFLILGNFFTLGIGLLFDSFSGAGFSFDRQHQYDLDTSHPLVCRPN